MNGLLIVHERDDDRAEMAALFTNDSYRVTTSDSVANALEGIWDKSIPVVLLGGSFSEQHVARFLPLLKKCNRHLAIVLVTEDIPFELLRKIRKEGIFYHALKPVSGEGWDEIRQVVACAFDSYRSRLGESIRKRDKGMIPRAKTVLTSLFCG